MYYDDSNKQEEENNNWIRYFDWLYYYDESNKHNEENKQLNTVLLLLNILHLILWYQQRRELATYKSNNRQ